MIVLADVVMMPLDHLAFDLAALSGARVVLSPFASRVPDAAAREAAVQAFFDRLREDELEAAANAAAGAGSDDAG